MVAVSYDDIARKIKSYMLNHKARLNEYVYGETQDSFVDQTMSCDEGEVIMYAKMYMNDLMSEETRPMNRIVKYSEFLAVYDIYKSVIQTMTLIRR